MSFEAAVLLFDAREGHKMFWHHQAESVSRLAVALTRVFDRDGRPAAHLPEAARKTLGRAVVLFPSALTSTVRALVRAGHETARALERTRRLRAYEWRAGRVYSIATAFVVDWPPAAARGAVPAWTPRVPRDDGGPGTACPGPGRDKSGAAEADEELPADVVPTPSWLEALALAAAPPGGRRYHESLFRLHFVPPAVLRLQAAFLRKAFPPQEDAAPVVLYYSRADSDKRHVKSEPALVDALRARFDGRIEVLQWVGGATPDIERAARDWSRAALVIGRVGKG